MAASLIEYGWTQPLLIGDDGTVIAGHGRLLPAQRPGLDAVPVTALAGILFSRRRRGRARGD